MTEEEEVEFRTAAQVVFECMETFLGYTEHKGIPLTKAAKRDREAWETVQPWIKELPVLMKK